MAHPGLALFGVIAVGLIGTGLWLRMEAARPLAPALPLALPPPATEAAAEAAATGPASDEAGPALEPEISPDPPAAEPAPSLRRALEIADRLAPAADPSPEADSLRRALEIADRLAQPAGAAAPSDPAPEPLAPQSTRPGFVPDTGLAPLVLRPTEPGGPAAAPEGTPDPAAEKPPLDPADEFAEPEPALEPEAPFAPITYSGASIWQPAPEAGFTPEQIAETRASARVVAGGAEYFGAMVLSPGTATGTGAQFFVQGYASLAAAEAGALRLCARMRDDCQIVAHLVPRDFDGTREGTLSAYQARVLLMARAGAQSRDAPLAFAWSPDGGAAYSSGAASPRGAALALDRCEADRRRLERDDAEMGCAFATEFGAEQP